MAEQVQYNVRLPSELYEWLREEKHATRRSLSELTVEALTVYRAARERQRERDEHDLTASA